MQNEDSYQKIIVEFITNNLGEERYLSYSDYEIIEGWLLQTPSFNDLLLLLDDVLPCYILKNKSKKQKFTLKGLNNLVLKTLKDKSNYC